MTTLASFNAAGGTVVLITHDMPAVAEHARRAVVLVEGQVLYDGSVSDLFGRRDLLVRAGLSLPPVVRLAQRLTRRAGLTAGIRTPADLADAWVGAEQAPPTATPMKPPARRTAHAENSDATGV